MGVWTEPSPSDWDRWENLILDNGMTPWDAARDLGFGGSSAFKRGDRAKHAEILQRWRDDRDEGDRQYVRDTLRENAERAMVAVPAIDRDGNETGTFTYEGSIANRSLELLGKIAGEFKDRVEMTGPDGGPMEVNNPDVAAAIDRFHDSLASAVARLAARAGTGNTPSAALPAGESAARIPVGGMARPTQPATTD